MSKDLGFFRGLRIFIDVLPGVGRDAMALRPEAPRRAAASTRVEAAHVLAPRIDVVPRDARRGGQQHASGGAAAALRGAPRCQVTEE